MGGLVGALVVLLVYDAYRQAGDVSRAEALAARALSPDLRRALGSARAREQLDRARRLLRAYREAAVDAVNFHWYEADPGALEEGVGYLRAHTRRPVLSNEIGQRSDEPAQTTAVMRKVVELGLPVAVWFARDGPKARGLVEPDGRLRAWGTAFQTFTRERFGLGRTR
jgi:hypothetical protein